MRVSIILLGEVTPSDRQLLRDIARAYDAEIRLSGPAGAWPEPDMQTDDPAARPDFLPQACAPARPKTCRRARACISFLPCERESLIRLFSAMPVGSGQEIPFFQRIEAENTPEFLKDMPVSGVFSRPLSQADAWNIMTAIVRQTALSAINRELINEIERYRTQKLHLINIGTALSSHNGIDKLLSLILSECRDLVNADAGSIYIRQKSAPGGVFIDSLQFKISQNDSVDVSGASEFSIPMNRETIAGYVASTGRLLNIEDVYRLPSSRPYHFGRQWDEKLGYRIKSMLTVPLANLTGEVVGVLQLMNKKKDKAGRISSPLETNARVIPFSISDEDFLISIGSQAAASIERAHLYKEIEAIFEGFLDSSIAAIDERDSITSGHSRRVMGYAMAFIDAVNADRTGPFQHIVFTEARKNQFRFAALLHDIGKIGVPEELLMKATRLSKGEMAAVRARMDLIALSMKTDGTGSSLPWDSPDDLEADWAFLETINRAGTLKQDDFDRLSTIRMKYYFNLKGGKSVFLTDHEWEALSVRIGNLTSRERERINSHTIATRRILSEIPWTKELELIPEIACHHHERIDGSGYPDGLQSNDISFESKVLAVIDIFEALVAQDRPYKPKMPPEKAIAILRSEAEAKHLDREIVEFFVDKEIYSIYSNEAKP